MQRNLLLVFFSLSFHHLGWAQDAHIAQGSSPSLLSVRGDTISLAGKKVELDPQGFPGELWSFITPATNILAENIHFHFTRQSDGKDIRLKSEGVIFTRQSSGLVEWSATNASDELRMDVSASLRSDGSLSYKVKLAALQDLDLKEITLHIPFEKGVAKKINGVGLGEDYPIGGLLIPRDSTRSWKVDTGYSNEAEVWIGSANAGLRYSLRGKEWGNEGRGGITVGIKGKSFLANNYSGAHSLKKGDELNYDFDLRITPL